MIGGGPTEYTFGELERLNRYVQRQQAEAKKAQRA